VDSEEHSWHWVGAAVAFVGFVYGTLAIGWHTGAERLKVLLVLVEPWVFDLLLLALAVVVWVERDLIVRAFCDVGRRRMAVVFGVAFGAVFFSAFAAPRTHRIYYDEDIYENVALNMILVRRAAMAHECIFEFGHYRLVAAELLKQPSGFPAVLGVWFRVFGVDEDMAFVFNNLMLFCSVVAVFFLGRRLWGDWRGGLYSAVCLAVVPQVLIWSNTVAVEPSAMLFAALGVLAALVFTTERSLGSFLLALLVTILAAQFRAESPILILLVAVIVTLWHKDAWRDERLWWLLLACLPFVVTMVWRFAAVSAEPWGSTEGKFGLHYLFADPPRRLAGNLYTNTVFYLDGRRFPVFLTLLFLLGLFVTRPYRVRLFVALWFLLWWGIFLGFYAGSYEYGVDVRYSLLSFVPLVLLAGGALAWLEQRLERWVALPTLRGLLLGSLAVCLVAYLPHIRVLGEEGWQAHEDHKFAKEIATLLPADSIVLTHDPSTLAMWQKSCVQTYYVRQNPQTVDGYFTRFRGGVYFFWNYWCNVDDPVQAGYCDDVLARYDAVLVKEHRMRDPKFRLALYKLSPRKKP